MARRLSDGDIAFIAGGLQEREKNPEGAQQLLEEIDQRIRAAEPIPHDSHLADYFHWAIKRLLNGHDADDAFGLTHPHNRPVQNAERDELIAFLVQRRMDSGTYTSEDAAALAVRDYLADTGLNLSHDRIRNIYRDHKEDPIIQAVAAVKPST